MSTLHANIAGIGFWCTGLPSWAAACDYLRDGTLPEGAPKRPAAQLLAANERRRAPDTVAVALEAALSACQSGGHDPATLPSVFTSTHGDLAITDYMCATLADDPRQISPTRFHNSVHNAAAGYWTIGAGAHTAATAISAGPASFAQGLLEAMTQLATDSEAVLLVGYDSQSSGPVAGPSPSHGLLGGALLLTRAGAAGQPQAHISLQLGNVSAPGATPSQLDGVIGGNAMQPMLPLFEALALRQPQATLVAGPQQWMQVDLRHG